MEQTITQVKANKVVKLISAESLSALEQEINYFLFNLPGAYRNDFSVEISYNPHRSTSSPHIACVTYWKAENW